MLRYLVGLCNERLKLGRQPRCLAEQIHADVLFLHFTDSLVQVLVQKLHYAADLILGTLPVFR